MLRHFVPSPLGDQNHGQLVFPVVLNLGNGSTRPCSYQDAGFEGFDSGLDPVMKGDVFFQNTLTPRKSASTGCDTCRTENLRTSADTTDSGHLWTYNMYLCMYVYIDIYIYIYIYIL